MAGHRNNLQPLTRIAAIAFTMAALTIAGMAAQTAVAYAEGESCDADGDGTDDGVVIGGECRGKPSPPDDDDNPDDPDNTPEDGTRTEEMYTYPCEPNHPDGDRWVRCEQLPSCGGGSRNETFMPYWQWTREVTWESGEVVDTTDWDYVRVCLPPDEVPREDRAPTREQISEEVERLLPKGKALIQPPNGKTLINFDTLFRVEVDDPWTEQVTVVGQTVDVRAYPTEFVWHFGDGEEKVTDEPGREYPHKDVVHQYQEVDTFDVDVDITYTAEFRLAGGDWNELGDIDITDGPVVPLEVVESRTALGGN